MKPKITKTYQQNFHQLIPRGQLHYQQQQATNIPNYSQSRKHPWETSPATSPQYLKQKHLALYQSQFDEDIHLL